MTTAANQPPSPAHPSAPPAFDLPSQYRPAEHEERIRQRWESSGAFHPDPQRVLRGEAKPYSIVIPPPNVTDRLHLGHALNNTLQDILARAHRMMGFETLWMPGTDHAGIATQAVVERRLRKEGKLKGPLKQAMKREEFVAIVQSFKDEYEATITDQLKRMGCSCDWARQRFTMDEICARAVREAFFRLFRDGLIYRGKRLVNWDPVLQTAVADDEVEDTEIDAHFYYLRYPLMHPCRDEEETTPVTWSELFARGYPVPPEAESPATEALYEDDKPAWVTVATTRPETYLGDVAVAVNPRDPRAASLRELCCELPLVGRRIPIVEDDYVVLPAAEGSEEADDPKAKFATGYLKVTPAHDANDYDLWQRHRKAIYHGAINVMAPDASISDKHGWEDVGDAHIFVGKSREEARKLVVREFEARGLYGGSRPYRHGVKVSDRSKAIIEPYLSDQWFVKVTDDRMAGSALRAMVEDQTAKQQSSKPAKEDDGDGSLRFYPDRYARTYQSWHENIRDWCISRQLWWGHRIPVWTHAVWMPKDPSGTSERPDTAVAVNEAWNPEGFPLSECAVQEYHDPKTGEWRWFVCPPSDRLDVIAALEAGRYAQEADVLDTWFSSALWPMSTMGWPSPPPEMTGLLEAFNPTSVLCTAREIITLWVSRMVMFNRYFMGGGEETERRRDGETETDPAGAGRGPVPFRDVFIHAMIQDGEGRKMSKSLGNGVDPLDIIASHGADAMRFILCHMTTHTQDVRMPVVKDPASGRNTSPKFDLGRNFCNKAWNATRFALSILQSEKRTANSEHSATQHSALSTQHSLLDRWMLSRLAASVAAIDAAIASYSFSEYAQSLYDLLWRDFCDWYLEGIKPTVAGDPRQRAVLAHALETIIRLLHPVAPFITETLWEKVREVETDPVEGFDLAPSRVGGLLCTAGWPRVSPSLRDEAAEAEFERLRTLITKVREVRAMQQVAPKRKVTLHLPLSLADITRSAPGLIETLAGVEKIEFGPIPASAAAFSAEGTACGLSNLADATDAATDRKRLEKQIADADKKIATFEGRLANPGYTDKAPPHMVQQTRDELAKAKAERDAAAGALGRLP